MTLEELQRVLAPSDGALRVESRSVGPDLQSLLEDYLGGVLDVALSPPSPALQRTAFRYDGLAHDAIRVTGSLRSTFLGYRGMAIEGTFFVANDRAEAVLTLTDPRDPWTLASVFPEIRGASLESGILHRCVFVLDSNRPYSLGDDFADLFAPEDAPPAPREGRLGGKTALSVRAQVVVTEVDEMLGRFFPSLADGAFVPVSGPVELSGKLPPRMRLTSEGPVATLSVPGLQSPLELQLHYHFLTAPSPTGDLEIREQLSATLPHLDLVPMRMTFEPNALSDALVIQSFDRESPLSFDALVRAMPGGVAHAIPERVPGLSDVRLTNLSCELAMAPLELKAVEVRVEVAPDGGWSLGGPRDLLVVKGLALEISVGRDGDEWRVQPYVSGRIELAGGTLDVGADVASGTLSCVLRKGEMILLTRLFTELGFDAATAGLPFGLGSGDGMALDQLEVLGTLDRSMYALDIGTKLGWPIPGTKVTIERLRLSLEYEETPPPTVTLGGSLTVAGVTIDLVASRRGDGWHFEGWSGRDQEIHLGRVIEEGVKLFDPKATLPPALRDFDIGNLGVSYTTGSHEFTFTCTGTIPLGGAGTALDCRIDIAIASRQATFGGVITVGGAEFTLEISSNEDAKELTATWHDAPGAPAPSLESMSGGLPGLSALEDLPIPRSARLTLHLGKDERLLSLAAEYGEGFRAAFLFAEDLRTTLPPRPTAGPPPPASIVALGVLLPTVSTDSLGPLGAALRPHNISVTNLKVVGANTDAPARSLPLDGAVAISKGLLLQGTLEFGGSSSSYSFDCRFGAEKTHEPSLPPPGPPGAARQPGPAPAPAVDHPPVVARVGDATWFDVQKSVGPLHVDRVGVRYADSRIWFLLSAALRAGPVTLGVQGLGIGVNPSKPTDLDVTLSGLDLSVKTGPVSVTGVFLKGEATVFGRDGLPELVDGKPQTIPRFAGEVRIALPTFSILGVGAYGRLNGGDPTLFLYAALSLADGEGIGSPPVVITGLALGFGINYRVVIPPVEDVMAFPLVAMVMGPGGTDGRAALAPAAPADPGAVLQTLLSSERPALQVFPGQSFGALGLRLTLFQRIDAFALAVVQAGVQLEISLLGLGRLKEPQEGDAICYIELALLADLRPGEGVLRIEARLTANAWVLEPSCHLTGGFALVVWYGGEHRGDFVLSIGGYHPRFPTPAHYPAVPRLGLNLQIGPVAMKGAAYFALTPSAIMAGGQLEAVFSDGPILASFTAYLDFLVQWKPLHYDIGAGIAIQIAVDLGLFTLHLALGVDLLIQGPPFHGTAHVHLGLISATIAFGAESSAPGPITEWSEFTASFLDRAAPPRPAAAAPPAAAGAVPAPAAAAPPQIHQLHLAAGRLTRPGAPGAQRAGDDDRVWEVRADELVLAGMSALPATKLALGKVAVGEPTLKEIIRARGDAASGVQRAIDKPLTATEVATRDGSPLGLRPMAVTKLESPLLVTIVDEETGSSVDRLEHWTLEEDRSAMPAAVWDVAALDPHATPDAKVLRGCVVGIRRLKPPVGGPRGEKVGGVTSRALAYDPLPDKRLAEEPGAQPAPVSAWDAIPRVDGDAALRGRIAAALAQAGFAEADRFGTRAPMSRPLEAVPLRSALSGMAG